MSERDTAEPTETITIGPECFTNGTVICYKGENYTRQPQQVTTAKELEALPDGTYIMDSEPDILSRYKGKWRSPNYPGDSFDAVALSLPATVLHVGASE